MVCAVCVTLMQMTRSEVEEEGGSVYAPTVQTARSVKEGKSNTVQWLTALPLTCRSVSKTFVFHCALAY
jgi:hypothetical protein